MKTKLNQIKKKIQYGTDGRWYFYSADEDTQEFWWESSDDRSMATYLLVWELRSMFGMSCEAAVEAVADLVRSPVPPGALPSRIISGRLAQCEPHQ